MKKIFLSILLISAVFISCEKDKNNDDGTPAPVPTAARSFENITFDNKYAFFSADGSMTSPVDSNTAKTISNKIDISYIVNYSYSEDGFLDPKTRSQHWYWDEYYKPWLNNSVETRFYTTALTKADFDAAKADESKIGTYFSSSSVVLAPHSIFPTGSCIGGRQSYNSTTGEYSILLSEGKVFGFKNTASGKRGLMYMRLDQVMLWPNPVVSSATKVDIIREN